MNVASIAYSIGCGGINTTAESIDLSLDEPEGALVRFSIVYLLLIGVLGVVLHGYIIFCYNFRKYESLCPTQMLITGLSVFDFIYCSGLLALTMFESFPQFNEHFACAFYFLFISFNRNSVHLVVLLLTTNRYYTICRPPQNYLFVFSKRRILYYLSLIFAYALVMTFLNQLNFCVPIVNSSTSAQDYVTFLYPVSTVESVRVLYSSKDYYLWATLVMDVMAFVPVMTLVICFIIRIRVKIKQQIARDEILNTWSGGNLEYDIRIERSYLKAITVSTMIAMPLLFVQFVLSSLEKLIQLAIVFTHVEQSSLFECEVAYLSIFSFLYILNPIIFLTTNDDFKLKMYRPIRVIKEHFNFSAKLKEARLDLNQSTF